MLGYPDVSVDLLDGVVRCGSEIAPITNYFFDKYAAEFVSVSKCLRVVAGPFPDGKWIAAEVMDEERAEAARLR